MAHNPKISVQIYKKMYFFQQFVSINCNKSIFFNNKFIAKSVHHIIVCFVNVSYYFKNANKFRDDLV